MTFLDDFLVRAALAGLGVALATAPLGCFVVWRRMAYYGDATAHAAVFGVALSLAFSMSIFLGVLVVSLLMAVAVTLLTRRGHAVDTLLGVMAHSGLAFGLVAVSFLPGMRVDIMSFLFGDILAVNTTDLSVIWAGALAVCGVIWMRWSALLTTTLSPDLGRAAGLNPEREQFVLSIALALVVAVAIKVVGALLIVSMLVIPAAAARPFARSPEQLVFVAMAIGAFAALSGLAVSFYADTPTGPTIVCTAALAFAFGHALPRRLRGERTD